MQHHSIDLNARLPYFGATALGFSLLFASPLGCVNDLDDESGNDGRPETLEEIKLGTLAPPCSPATASAKINGQSSATLSMCQSSPMMLNGTASTCASGYFVSVVKSDANWGITGSEYGRWLNAADFASFGALGSFNVKAFYGSYAQSFAPGEYYRVKLAVGSPWNETVKLIYIKPATPSFTINGMSPPPDNSPLSVCASNVTINASATSCESKYYIGVAESDLWWNRTYDYEWGKWFSGEAPSSLNLQQLATTYSYAPNFTGSPARQGSPLIGGNLPAGGSRYYRLSVCTGEPSWTCKFALLQVNGNCLVSSPLPAEADASSSMAAIALPDPCDDPTEHEPMTDQ